MIPLDGTGQGRAPGAAESQAPIPARVRPGGESTAPLEGDHPGHSAAHCVTRTFRRALLFEELLFALHKFGRHRPSCAFARWAALCLGTGDPPACDCGLAEVLAAAEAAR